MLKELEPSQQWQKAVQFFKETTGKKVDVNAALFLIGVQELGHGPKNFSKEEKQDLMHIATCKLLSFAGHYALKGLDEDGWPHYDLVIPVPAYNLDDQETMLKALIVDYLRLELDVNI